MLTKPNLNKPVFIMFPEAKSLVEQGLCPICSQKIEENDFKDELSRREYSVSGLCQNCQDNTFKRR